MFSRLGYQTVSAWRSGLLRESKFALNRAIQSSVAASQQKLAAIQEPTALAKVALEEGKEQYDQGLMYNGYPYPVEVVDVPADSMAEIKKNDEPIEDEFRVWFGKDMPTILDEQKPERDLVNFPRWIRPINPPKTRLIIFPEEWFQFFYNKTGVTGPYLFGAGFATFLLSKEFFIIEHNFWQGVSLGLVIYIGLKKFGPSANKKLEGAMAQEIHGWLNYQDGMIRSLENYITKLKKGIESIKNQKILFDAKRENVHLQREAEYRRRAMIVYEETKRKLNYQLAMQDAQRQFAQKHMVNWIIDSVHKGINAEQEQLAMSQALADLKALSVKKANVI